MSSKISDKDKKDWENFLSKKEKLVSKDQENKNFVIMPTRDFSNALKYLMRLKFQILVIVVIK